jgi:hypothetical protein
LNLVDTGGIYLRLMAVVLNGARMFVVDTYQRPCFDMAWDGFKYCRFERVGDGLMYSLKRLAMVIKVSTVNGRYVVRLFT